MESPLATSDWEFIFRPVDSDPTYRLPLNQSFGAIEMDLLSVCFHRFISECISFDAK
jgi:hypothetical protein